MNRLHQLLAHLIPRLALCLLAGALWATGVHAASGSDVSGNAASVQVQDGDMASVLAFRLKPRGSTIEQMMVALLRLNPGAFLQGNVNLLQGGAVLRLPPPDDVFRTPPEEAKDTVQRHHQNFLRDLEASVAKALPAAKVQSASQETPAALPADQATEREALLEKLRTAKAHLSELQHNIQELERLTRDEDLAPAQPPAPSSTPLPESWIWLGVAAIVAVMVGVGASRRPGPASPHKSAAPAAQAAAAAEFQTRLGGLNLDLGSPPGPAFPDQSK